MRAVALRAHGDPSVLERMELEEPAVRPGTVLVEIHACAVNRLDLWVRAGLPNLTIAYPHVLGSDVAGIVAGVGTGVDAGWIGKEVVLSPGLSCGACPRCLEGRDNLCPDYRILGENAPGGYAQRIVVPVANLLPKPAQLDMIAASTIPLTFLTAWEMLVGRAGVQPGDVVLIHAVGSGVGVAALQIARRLGARVIALASTDTKLERAVELGAERTVRSDRADWSREVRAIPFVGKRGVDVVVDHVGADTWSSSIKLIRNGGTLVTCGASSGHKVETDLRHVFFRQIQIRGSTMGRKADLFRIVDLVERGELRPIVDRVFALEEAAEAHRYLDRREQFGKVVLRVR